MTLLNNWNMKINVLFLLILILVPSSLALFENNNYILAKCTPNITLCQNIYLLQNGSEITYNETDPIWNSQKNNYNNYTSNIGFSGTGTKTLNLARIGMNNLTASFTDIDTTYTNGTGLSLIGTTFSLTLSYLNNLFYNKTEMDNNLSNKLDITDQRYNETTLTNTKLVDVISANNYITVSGTTNKTLAFQESVLNTTIANALATTYYNVTNITVITGTGNGTLQNINAYDNIPYNITEVLADIDVNLTIDNNITIFNQLVIRYKTIVGETHYLGVYLWDYNSSSWETYDTLSNTDGVYNIRTISVFDYSEHVFNNSIKMRLYTNNIGAINGKWDFDWVTASKGVASQVGTELDPLSIHRNGDTPLTANWNVGDYNITINGTLNASRITTQDFINYQAEKYPLCIDEYMSALSNKQCWLGVGIIGGAGTLITGNGARHHPGVNILRSLANGNNSGYQMSTISTSIEINGSEYFKAIINMPTALSGTNESTTRIGYSDSITSIIPVDAIMFRIYGNSTGWQIIGITRSNNVETNTTTHFFNSNLLAYYKLYLEVNSNATQVNFYVYNSSNGDTALLWNESLTNTTTIPKGPARILGNGVVSFLEQNRSSAVVNLITLDYMEMGTYNPILR